MRRENLAQNGTLQNRSHSSQKPKLTWHRMVHHKTVPVRVKSQNSLCMASRKRGNSVRSRVIPKQCIAQTAVRLNHCSLNSRADRQRVPRESQDRSGIGLKIERQRGGQLVGHKVICALTRLVKASQSIRHCTSNDCGSCQQDEHKAHEHKITLKKTSTKKIKQNQQKQKNKKEQVCSTIIQKPDNIVPPVLSKNVVFFFHFLLKHQISLCV
jgi:hypothetical protein